MVTNARVDEAEEVAGKLSLEEFERLPESGDLRLELTDGRLVREPRPGARHGWLAGQLFRSLDAYAREKGRGLAVIEAGFLLSVDPPTVRGPDVAFISDLAIPPDEIPTGFWTVAPQLAVEVMSPSNSAAEIQERVVDYLAAGTSMVWVVDPHTRSVTVFRSRDEVQWLTERDVLDGLDVLPDFRIELSGLFPPRS